MGGDAARLRLAAPSARRRFSAITRANARALVDDWITLQGGWHPLGWRADILSRRIISWLSQAPLVLQDADARFYRRFIRSLTRQVRYLRRTLKRVARRRAAPAGADRADLRGALHAGPVRPSARAMRAA